MQPVAVEPPTHVVAGDRQPVIDALWWLLLVERNRLLMLEDQLRANECTIARLQQEQAAARK